MVRTVPKGRRETTLAFSRHSSTVLFIRHIAPCPFYLHRRRAVFQGKQTPDKILTVHRHLIHNGCVSLLL